jgi:hypothetical protein
VAELLVLKRTEEKEQSMAHSEFSINAAEPIGCPGVGGGANLLCTPLHSDPSFPVIVKGQYTPET